MATTQQHSTDPTTKLETPRAADYLGLSPTTLETWRVHGKGPRFLKLGRRVLYRVSDLDAYLDSCVRGSTTEAA